MFVARLKLIATAFSSITTVKYEKDISQAFVAGLKNLDHLLTWPDLVSARNEFPQHIILLPT